jgi:hypothetical protein
MNRSQLHAIILSAALSVIFDSTAMADFVERTAITSQEDLLTGLKKEARSLEGRSVVLILQADAGAPILSIARGGEGYKISILISQFMLEGHGDVGNEEVYLDTFPVKVIGTRKVAFQHLIESQGIVEILNKAHCRFRMVSVGMRERDGGVISWAQSRIETTAVDQDLLDSLLSEIGPVAFNGAKGNKFISWGRRENEP